MVSAQTVTFPEPWLTGAQARGLAVAALCLVGAFLLARLLLGTPRAVRPGRVVCRRCRYALDAPMNRCPECGNDVVAVSQRMSEKNYLPMLPRLGLRLAVVGVLPLVAAQMVWLVGRDWIWRRFLSGGAGDRQDMWSAGILLVCWTLVVLAGLIAVARVVVPRGVWRQARPWSPPET